MAHLCMSLCCMPLKAFDKVNHSKLFTELTEAVLLLCTFSITGTALRNSLSDGVVASLDTRVYGHCSYIFVTTMMQ